MMIPRPAHVKAESERSIYSSRVLLRVLSYPIPNISLFLHPPSYPPLFLLPPLTLTPTLLCTDIQRPTPATHHNELEYNRYIHPPIRTYIQVYIDVLNTT